MASGGRAGTPAAAGWRRWFVGGHGLRAGWCFLYFAVLYVLLDMGGSLLYERMNPAAKARGWKPATFLGGEAVSLAVALALLFAVCAWRFRRGVPESLALS